ncbi:sensor histidine kinase [Cellulomonas humilata]|uniref:Sensor histidine kinase n=1 Tax=Cellulomonas humilata TaxID=144055 RepID=A0A7Y6A4C3_9CELL|nr:ATP-binding protein [Cellulomonas humilata]NUU19527.1 sensor histidine kinase [Cellulomonas humilata]
MQVTLPNRAYLADIERFTRLMVVDGTDDLRFVLPDGLFSVHPLVLCMIGALGDWASDQGAEVSVHWEDLNSSIRYLERMKLFEVMDLPTGIPVREHDPSGRFIPVTRIRDNAELNKFVVDFVPLLHARPEEADSVKYVLFELVRNVLEHASSAHGALAAAQVTKSGRLLVGVADSGIGVRASMGRSHPVTSDQDAIEKAFRPGITGTTRHYGGNETNGGAGLFFMKAMATMSRHHMVMATGDSLMKLLTQPRGHQARIHARLQEDRVKWVNLAVPYPGTAVGIDISIDETIAFSRLLADIREVYHLNVKKSKIEKYRPRFR